MGHIYNLGVQSYSFGTPEKCARSVMMHLLTLLVWAVSACAVVVPQSTEDGIRNLVKRRLPDHVNDFEFRLVGDSTGSPPFTTTPANDEYSVSSTPDGKILVEGNSPIALASG
jgi:alpha-N-acetylglucosaminidase